MKTRQAEGVASTHNYPLLIHQILRTAIDTRTKNEIVGSEGQRISYPEFGRRVAQLASALEKLGVRAGDVVAIMDWDSHRYLETYFAVPMMGAVLQTVNVRLAPDQIAYTLRETGARVILLHHDFAELFDAIKADLPLFETTIGLAGVSDQYEKLLKQGAADFEFPEFSETAVATTFHTTGTTGLPKAVAFSHRQLVLHTLALAANLSAQPDEQSFRRDDVYMPITPMFHVHAWGIPYVATMLGVKQVYPGRYLPERLLALKEDEGVTFSHGVPTIVQMLIDAIGDRNATRRWKMIVGGSAFPTSLHRAAMERGIHAYAGYGMSETGPVLTMARHSGDGDEASAEVALCRAGRPIPLVQLRIAHDPPGEVIVRAPWLTPGYQGDPEASTGLWSGGWLHTQDVAERLENGDLVIRDRLKDVIKTGGEWVSSAEVEELLMRHSDILAAAVVGIADVRWGERPIAFVVGRLGEFSAAEVVRAHLKPFIRRGKISKYAVPDRIHILDALPRTSVGKIDKKALRHLAENSAC